jgi:hypothetical protein
VTPTPVKETTKKKETNMFNFKTSDEALDRENNSLIMASKLLESISNDPEGITSDDLVLAMEKENITVDNPDFVQIMQAAVSIEVMMVYDARDMDTGIAFPDPPTIH